MTRQNRFFIFGRRQAKRARAQLRRQLRCETLETRQLMANDLTMGIHNSLTAEDVNGDGIVSPSDALNVISAMHRMRTGQAIDSSLRCDVNHDGSITPLDALMVINRLNNRNSQPPAIPTPTPTTSAGVRSIDGTGNNLANPSWGSSNEQLLRVADVDYADGIAAPAGTDRPSAREISNMLSDHGVDAIPNDRDVSAFLYVWGQFLDHDLSLTETGETQEAFAIKVPTGDPSFDPNSLGNKQIPLLRSNYDATTGTDLDNPRQQLSSLTAWIDGSQVYGSDETTANGLRELSGGRMLIDQAGLLPTDTSGQFLAGDIRANENPELSAMQTLFVREHNYWAARIAAGNRQLNDEAIYQQARAMVIAELQSITYNEFLPSLIGKQALPNYRGYDASVNPTISNEFSTAAFRFGHSTLNDDIEFFGNDGRAIRDEISLAEAFFNPEILKQEGIDPILKYVASTLAEEIDVKVVDSLRNLLFGQPGQGGLDLVALNIQRGRDHGLADYNSVRQAYGLESAQSYADITSDVELQQQLQSLYGDVGNIDLWVGILAEDHVAGASIGELGKTIIADQFQRLRDGDRFWFENVFQGKQLQQITSTRLSDVIERNTQITNLQPNVFSMHVEVSGKVVLAPNPVAATPAGRPVGPQGPGPEVARPQGPSAQGPSSQGPGSQGTGSRGPTPNLSVSGVTVELLNADGEVIDSTKTNQQGQYTFSNFSETGDYRIQVVLAPNLTTRVSSLDILVSNGATRLQDLNFVVTRI